MILFDNFNFLILEIGFQINMQYSSFVVGRLCY